MFIKKASNIQRALNILNIINDLEKELGIKIKHELGKWENVSNEATSNKLKAILEKYMDKSSCKICNKIGKSSHLMDHMETHVKVSLYSCEYCEKSSSNFRAMKVHINKCPLSLALE